MWVCGVIACGALIVGGTAISSVPGTIDEALPMSGLQ